MITHPMGSVPLLEDVLMWDPIEGEWRIGHVRTMPDIEQDYYMACTVREAADLITDGEPAPVFARVTQWAPLPPKREVE